MKTYNEYRDKYEMLAPESPESDVFTVKTDCVWLDDLENALTERDKEWKQKIQTALDKTSNWNCKEVLTKLLEDK